jgi:hypothetical protein
VLVLADATFVQNERNELRVQLKGILQLFFLSHRLLFEKVEKTASASSLSSSLISWILSFALRCKLASVALAMTCWTRSRRRTISEKLQARYKWRKLLLLEMLKDRIESRNGVYIYASKDISLSSRAYDCTVRKQSSYESYESYE